VQEIRSGSSTTSAAALSEQQLVAFARAVANPVRLRVLLIATAHDEFTPRAVASELKIGLGRLSYHIRYLADMGALELRRTTLVRGAVQHVYGLSADTRTFTEAAIRSGLIEGEPR
jgi:DNA-binding transcriptional ArsR family regulator